jgi:hypothetical protein
VGPAAVVGGLLIADGSICPTEPAANLALTIKAMSSPLAQLLATGALDPHRVRGEAGRP